MSTWLTAWRNRETRESNDSIMELMVLEGADAGNQFTIEGDRVLVGRGQPESGHTDVIRLEDKSISRRQAWIRRDPSGTSIEHVEEASNPTLVNGVSIARATLAVGDRIEMGRVLIDVRARGGMNLRGLTEIMEDAARESTQTGATSIAPASSVPAQIDDVESLADTTQTPSAVSEAQTDVRPMELLVGELVLMRGLDDAMGRRFPFRAGTTRIGRGEDVEVRVAELGVSRLHAEIVVDGRSIRLVPQSRTNPTLINGFPVHGSVELGDGDEIQLADRVALGVRLALPSRFAPTKASDAHSGLSGLSGRMEHKIHLEREIEEYSVMGSFLDVDVVASREMKRRGERAEHIIVSFERFRSFVGHVCEEWNGQVLNSNGDELMCFFESAAAAVGAGRSILDRLDEFNREQNLLTRDFRFRLGVHTGVSLVDLNAGIAYSEVLDTAGHIQKLADPNTLLVSQTTVDSLPPEIVATPVAEMTGDAGALYRVD